MKKKHKSTPFRIFLILAMAIYGLFIMVFALFLGTQKYPLQKLSKEYVKSAEIPSNYYEVYEQAGFTSEQSRSYLGSKPLREVIADVMIQCLLYTFNETDGFKDVNCHERVQQSLKDFCEKEQIQIKDPSALTKYTMDITGITTMLEQKTPYAYKSSVFMQKENTFSPQQVKSILKILKSLSIWYLPLVIFFLYCIVLIVMLIVRSEEDKRNGIKPFMDASVYPGLFFAALGLARMLAKPQDLYLNVYVCKWLILSASSGIFLGVCMYICCYFIIKKESERL